MNHYYHYPHAVMPFGVITYVDKDTFIDMVEKATDPIVLQASKRLFIGYRYVTNYKGLVFTTKSPKELEFPRETEIIRVK